MLAAGAALVAVVVLALLVLRPFSDPGPRSGVFEGGLVAPEVRAFEQWRGQPVDVVLSFAAQRTWADLEVPGWWTGYWARSDYADRMLLSLAMLPEEPVTSLQEGAEGAYDRHFEAAARNLVAAGLGDVTIRVGHELNGDWYRWSARDDPEAYAAYWRRIVAAMRSVPGQSFTFEWNVSVGVTDVDATLAWPGDEWVDVVGLDVYDMKYGDPDATPEQRWAHLVAPETGRHRHGLQFWAEFAEAHGKPLGFSEWGVVDRDAPMAAGGGGGDNPLFISRMYDWFERHDVAYEVYFNVDAGDGAHALDNPAFAESAARYRGARPRQPRLRRVGGALPGRAPGLTPPRARISPERGSSWVFPGSTSTVSP